MVVAGDMEPMSGGVLICRLSLSSPKLSLRLLDSERSHMLICVKWADWLILLKNSPRPTDERVARFQPLPRPSCIRRGLGPLQEYTKDQLFFSIN